MLGDVGAPSVHEFAATNTVDGRPAVRRRVHGILPGGLAACAAARAMSALLFGIAPGDPATFAAAVIAAVAMALAGSLIPAMRAVRVTPMSVLRSD